MAIPSDASKPDPATSNRAFPDPASPDPERQKKPNMGVVEVNLERKGVAGTPSARTLRELQVLIRQLFGEKDARRGPEATFMWFMEEVGELAAALREADRANLEAEFADVFAWLLTLANICDVDLTAAIWSKYGQGCPTCHLKPCRCDPTHKP